MAAVLWLRRRPAERPALAPGEAPAPPMPAPRVPSTRWGRTPEAREIDIVAVVDDLLGPP
ncbi:MAG TPA: hypothetical protein VNC17_19485 [Thermoleophilaceae bacterium]|nr:hypothetical protein [Thermoleophilaceae bacterium]